jgi:hypothetical protein
VGCILARRQIADVTGNIVLIWSSVVTLFDRTLS